MVLLNFNNQKHLQLIDFIFNIFILMITNIYIYVSLVGVDRLSAWPIIGADIKHFYDYRYRPFSKQICR